LAMAQAPAGLKSEHARVLCHFTSRWAASAEGQQQTADQGKKQKANRDANKAERRQIQRVFAILKEMNTLQGHGFEG